MSLHTKAEFDSALADFNARLTTFEAGINSKIDSQVTSYLDRNGIWNGKELEFNTSDLDANGFYWFPERKNLWNRGQFLVSPIYTNDSDITLTANKDIWNQLCFREIGVARKAGLLLLVIEWDGAGTPYDRWMGTNSSTNTFNCFDQLQMGVGKQTKIVKQLWGSSPGTGTDMTFNDISQVLYSAFMTSCVAVGSAGGLYGTPKQVINFMVNSNDVIYLARDIFVRCNSTNGSLNRSNSYGGTDIGNRPHFKIESAKVY